MFSYANDLNSNYTISQTMSVLMYVSRESVARHVLKTLGVRKRAAVSLVAVSPVAGKTETVLTPPPVSMATAKQHVL